MGGFPLDTQTRPCYLKVSWVDEGVSKGRSQPEIADPAFLILYMVLGQPFLCWVLILTQVLMNPTVGGRHWVPDAQPLRADMWPCPTPQGIFGHW